MYNGLLHLHNFLRWVILVLILIAIFRHLTGMNSKRPVNAGDKKVDLFLMIAAHITLLVGLYQWIAGPRGLSLITNGGDLGERSIRQFALEHPVGMIIAIVLITIGRGAVKRATTPAAHKKAFWCFLIALIVMLATIPWSRPLFPGMH